jgi:hypothetical protein
MLVLVSQTSPVVEQIIYKAEIIILFLVEFQYVDSVKKIIIRGIHRTVNPNNEVTSGACSTENKVAKLGASLVRNR